MPRDKEAIWYKFRVEKVTKYNDEIYYTLYELPDHFGANDTETYPPSGKLLMKGLLSIEEAEEWAEAYVGRKVKSVETVKTFNI